jgi:hypothetical protein
MKWRKIENVAGRQVAVVFYPEHRLAIEGLGTDGKRLVLESLKWAKLVCARHHAEKNEPGTYCLEDTSPSGQSIQEAKV